MVVFKKIVIGEEVFIKEMRVGSKNVFASKKTMRSKFDLKKNSYWG